MSESFENGYCFDCGKRTCFEDAICMLCGSYRGNNRRIKLKPGTKEYEVNEKMRTKLNRGYDGL